MSNSEKIEDQEIHIATQLTGIEPKFDNKYPTCLIFNDVGLPEGWSKSKTNVMLIKNKDNWISFVDADIEKSPSEFENILSPYAQDGWCELVIDNQNSIKLENTMDYLINKLKFVFAGTEISDANEKNLGLLKNIITYMDENKLKIVYEYIGPRTIISEEIYSINNQIKKVLGVREIEEGWIFQEWDFIDGEGKMVENGFYLLKIRSAQDAGDMFQIIMIHKNIKDN
jgi:hypothetical protein